MDYGRNRQSALKLISKFGVSCVLRTDRAVNQNGTPAWKPSRSFTDTSDLKCVIFDDDGETFVNHNVSGRTRIILLAPDTRVTNINVGDKVIVANEVLNVELIKMLNPDASGAILWTLLTV